MPITQFTGTATTGVDTHTFDSRVQRVEVYAAPEGAVTFTVNGDDPTEGISSGYTVPAGGARTVNVSGAQRTVVKLAAFGDATDYIITSV